MDNTTYFTFVENSPLNNPDTSDAPTIGYVSTNREPDTEIGVGTVLPNQLLEDSTCYGITVETVNVRGKPTRVSWVSRETVNEYGATKRPPKN